MEAKETNEVYQQLELVHILGAVDTLSILRKSIHLRALFEPVEYGLTSE